MSLKHEVLKTGENYFQDLNYYGKIIFLFLFGFIFLYVLIIYFLGLKLRGVVHAAKNYQVVVEENRRLYNEVQELKGIIFFKKV